MHGDGLPTAGMRKGRVEFRHAEWLIVTLWLHCDVIRYIEWTRHYAKGNCDAMGQLWKVENQDMQERMMASVILGAKGGYEEEEARKTGQED